MAELYPRIYERYLEDPGKLEEDLANDLALCPETHEREAYRQASLYSKWAILASIAENGYRTYKDFINTHIWPDAMEEARKSLLTEDTKPTKERCETLAYKNPAYINAARTKNKLGLILDKIKKAENSMYQRRDMIQSMSYRNNKEANSTPRPLLPTAVKDIAEYVDQSLTQQPKRSQEELERLAEETIRRSRNAS